MIYDAVVSGALRGKGCDASSGNTGIAYAIFGAASGFGNTILKMQLKKKQILKALGVS